MSRMDSSLIQEINTRLFFAAGRKYQEPALRPWQYVEMEYARMGLTPPANIPPLETMEDAEIWMCLDERVNRRMRMAEPAVSTYRVAI